jgi:hypothetical protein
LREVGWACPVLASIRAVERVVRLKGIAHVVDQNAVGGGTRRSGVNAQGNGWLTIFWIVMIPVSILTGWISKVGYVPVLSLWALVSSHWSAWQAARLEVAQQIEVQRAEEHPVEDRVVKSSSRTQPSNRPAERVAARSPVERLRGVKATVLSTNPGGGR